MSAPATQRIGRPTLYEGKNADKADRHEKRFCHDPCRQSDDCHRIECIEEIGSRADYHYYYVVPWNMIDPLNSFFHGEGEKAKQNDHSHEYGIADFLKCNVPPEEW